MNKLVAFAMLVSMLMFGCMGITEEGAYPSEGGSGMAKEALAPSYSASGDYSGSSQYVTKEGSISIKVQEGTLQEKFDDMKGKLSAQGAETSEIRYSEYGDRKQYTMTIKVAPSKFESINEMLKGIGEVKDISVQLEDVTQQYTDLDTRIKNKEIELERLYKLYNKSDNVSDLLDVEREVTRVETDLELLKGQKQYLVSKVERSTIAITIYEEKPASTQLTLPLESLGQWFFAAVAVAISLIVVAAGFLLPIAVVLGLIWLVYTKFFAQKKGKPKNPEHSKIPPPG
ncbi:MAG: DUF4349 domain-containing protein [Candidatus Micrarchaeota archaeon]